MAAAAFSVRVPSDSVAVSRCAQSFSVTGFVCVCAYFRRRRRRRRCAFGVYYSFVFFFFVFNFSFVVRVFFHLPIFVFRRDLRIIHRTVVFGRHSALFAAHSLAETFGRRRHVLATSACHGTTLSRFIVVELKSTDRSRSVTRLKSVFWFDFRRAPIGR